LTAKPGLWVDQAPEPWSIPHHERTGSDLYSRTVASARLSLSFYQECHPAKPGP